jgi:hypothetical protein
MFNKRIIIIISCVFCFSIAKAQAPASEIEADVKSLELYNNSQWAQLLTYGKSAIAAGIDFPLLRMRTGYSAFMLGNFSQSLLQYKKALQADSTNDIARYYCYLNNLYLNNLSVARYYAAKLPTATRDADKIHRSKLTSIQAEYSFKAPDNASRGDAQYGRIGATAQLGYKTELDVSGAFYSQAISETKLTGVTNSSNININQKEFYAKLVAAASGNVSIIGGYHYLYTPFNNFIYNNNIGIVGVKLHTPYVNIQAAANIGNIGDTTFQQYDGTITIYPLGNLKLYTISRVSAGEDVTFSQVAGVDIFKGVWLEGNVVVGQYKTLLENDALYVYNDVDTKKLKAGGSVYITLSKHLTGSINYTLERKLKYNTTNNSFNQHSITGGLTWYF